MNNDNNKEKGIAIWLISIIVLMCIIFAGFYFILKNQKTETTGNYIAENVTTVTTQAPVVITSIAKLQIDNDEIYSSNAILMRDDGVVLYEKKSRDKVYPASLTKMMTAVVALENIDNLDETVVIPQEVFDYTTEQEASIAGFSSGVDVSLRNILYGLLLPSGAECSVELANYVGGNEDDFSKMMNEKANELGMESSHFTNSSGLHDDNLYSTVSDMIKLERYALSISDFREIFTTSSYDAVCGDGSTVTLNSTLFSALESAEFDGGKIIGGKTGFTDEAGLCLASVAQIGNHEYMLVTAHAEGDHSTEQYNISDALTIYKAAANLYN